MKKSVSILLMLLAILLVPILAWATQADASFKFSLDASGDAVITGYVGSAIDVTIPETLAGHRVTAIGEAAFMNKDTLTGISLPDGILSIDRSALRTAGVQFPSTFPSRFEKSAPTRLRIASAWSAPRCPKASQH